MFDPLGSDLTIAAWIYVDTGQASTVLMIHHHTDADRGAYMYLTAGLEMGVNRWRLSLDSFKGRYGTGGLTTGSWQHVCVTSDSGGDADGMEAYVDGSIPGSSSTQYGIGSEYAHAGSWSVGGRIYNDNFNLDGKVAEVGVWDRILDTSEIASLAKRFSPQFFLRGLRFYTALIGYKDIDRIAGKTPTYDGTTPAPHPRILYPY